MKKCVSPREGEVDEQGRLPIDSGMKIAIRVEFQHDHAVRDGGIPNS